MCGSIVAQETTLQDLINQAAGEVINPKPIKGFRRLKSDWVGDITDKNGKVTKLRLEYGILLNGKPCLARMFNNRFIQSDAPTYIEKLPKGEDLESLKTVKELEEHFGKSQGFTSGWGGNDRMHWTVAWTFVTPSEENRLRYLSVFARVSKAGAPKSE